MTAASQFALKFRGYKITGTVRFDLRMLITRSPARWRKAAKKLNDGLNQVIDFVKEWTGAVDQNGEFGDATDYYTEDNWPQMHARRPIQVDEEIPPSTVESDELPSSDEDDEYLQPTPQTNAASSIPQV